MKSEIRAINSFAAENRNARGGFAGRVALGKNLPKASKDPELLQNSNTRRAAEQFARRENSGKTQSLRVHSCATW
jgi:hypothetical protein